MSIPRSEPESVVDLDHLAIPRLGTSKRDSTGCGCDDRRSRRSRDVNAFVWQVEVMDGMIPTMTERA